MSTKVGWLLLLLLILLAIEFDGVARPARTEKRVIEAVRVTDHIKIDGFLNESVWNEAKVANDFVQYEPFNGSSPSERTEVRVLYDDNAIYIGATLFDSNHREIFKELGQRDNSDRLKADVFTVLVSPYNDGINYVEFIVSASGVQTDIRHTGTRTDRSWDAVWDSKVSINENGWIVEIKIPYSALRFSSRIEGNWGLNFRRLIKRYNEWSSWNPIDNSISGIVNQSGELAGIRNINSPIRLSLSPYLSGYLDWLPDAKTPKFRFNGGMDVKYGITESFTLDMILIPDFGQVKSDDKILNISPYEVQYSEQRPFFTEGMDLFQKGGIFYTRRIGSRPKGYFGVYNDLGDNEVVDVNPQETNLINATKITGRTSSGLGIGFFNAMTSRTLATVRDTLTGEEREVQTQDFTNYNMLVLDQTLPRNSYISIANTNLLISGSEYVSNVSAVDFILRDKPNRYALTGTGAISHIASENRDLGHKHYLAFHKTSGSILYNVWNNTESKTYNPNDMGFLQKPNEFSNGFGLGYRIYRPFWKLLGWSSWVGGSYSMLYEPRVYTSSHFYFSANTTFARTYHSVGVNFWVDPMERHDFDEPRVENKVLIRARRLSGNFWTSSDYRKLLAIDTQAGYWKSERMDQGSMYGSLSPRLRLSDNMFLVYRIRQDFEWNNMGYVGRADDNSTIYFGIRDVSTLTNTFDGLYSFSANSFINLRVRHYWRWLDYTSYHELLADGSLSQPLDGYPDDKNINYNLFNIDLTYQWNFAPGSIFSIVWKNAIEASNSEVRTQLFYNIVNTLEESQVNSISFRVLYYIDYQSVVQRKRGVS